MPWITKPCEFCSKIFTSQSWVGHERKFCSCSCNLKNRISKDPVIFFGRKNPFSKRLDKCKECGEEFWKRHIDSIFCCKLCCLKWKKKNSIKKCVVCKKEFIKKSLYTKHTIPTCSRECRNKLGYVNHKMDPSNVWPNKNRRKLMKMIHGNKCQKCSNGPERVEFHHIDCNPKNNPEDGSNWMPLCKKCHYWVHRAIKDNNGPLTRDEIIEKPYEEFARRRRGKRVQKTK